MTIEELREQIEARLREAREEVARLKAALDALGHGGGNAAPVGVAKAHPQPRARATPKRRRAPRGATRHAVLEALAEGNAMTAGQLATATGLPRERVATELSKLVKTGDLVKADRGYKAPASEASASASSATSTATPNSNGADRPPSVRALGRELDSGLRTRTRT
jgi:DNA-binding transcriptional ArsR family regulator